MPLFSSWIHGVAAQPALRTMDSEKAGDVLGQNDMEPTETNPGALYCAKRFRRQSGDVESFYFFVPTPTVVLGTRANVLRILLMYDFDPGAAIDLITVFDGPFPIPGTPLVFWGMCVVVSVKFTQDATIRFTAVGADFEVR
jgi:hypothetical protein